MGVAELPDVGKRPPQMVVLERREIEGPAGVARIVRSAPAPIRYRSPHLHQVPAARPRQEFGQFEVAFRGTGVGLGPAPDERVEHDKFRKAGPEADRLVVVSAHSHVKIVEQRGADRCSLAVVDVLRRPGVIRGRFLQLKATSPQVPVGHSLKFVSN